jgi:ribosome-binding ATPase
LTRLLANNPSFFVICPISFIRAETIGYNDLVAAGSEKSAKEKGVLRSEGKEYVVGEGDVMLFRFNV